MNSSKLKDRALVAEIASAIAVVFSLIFLAIQIRDSTEQTALNTEAIQSTALQQHFAQHSEFIFFPISDQNFRAVLTKARREGMSALNDDERLLFFPFAAQHIRSFFAGYQMMQSGILPEDEWQTFEGALGRTLSRNLGYPDVWAFRRHDYPDDFQQLVDKLIDELNGSQ